MLYLCNNIVLLIYNVPMLYIYSLPASQVTLLIVYIKYKRSSTVINECCGYFWVEYGLLGMLRKYYLSRRISVF